MVFIWSETLCTKTTKGIIPEIIKQANSDETDEKCSKLIDDILKTTMTIFTRSTDNKPRLVACGRCMDIVEVKAGNDCRCGYIQELTKIILKGTKDEHSNIK